jgi:DNA-binding CsgD family transcriptional regulator
MRADSRELAGVQMRGRALIYDPEPIVCERVRQMAAAEGFASCVVDRFELFEELRQLARFDLYVVGSTGLDDVQRLEPARALDPLLLLTPRAGRAESAIHSAVLPNAVVVERQLRDPNALRRALGLDDAVRPLLLDPDSVRRAFAEFGLSERQLEVLGLALRGAPGSDIARRLFISELTVRNHLHAIYERVGVSGRRELLGRFVQGLMEGHA